MIYTTPDIRPIHSYRIHTSEATFLNWMGVDKKYKSVMHKLKVKRACGISKFARVLLMFSAIYKFP